MTQSLIPAFKKVFLKIRKVDSSLCLKIVDLNGLLIDEYRIPLENSEIPSEDANKNVV